jgi:hypothetical protein
MFDFDFSFHISIVWSLSYSSQKITIHFNLTLSILSWLCKKIPKIQFSSSVTIIHEESLIHRVQTQSSTHFLISAFVGIFKLAFAFKSHKLFNKHAVAGEHNPLGEWVGDFCPFSFCSVFIRFVHLLSDWLLLCLFIYFLLISQRVKNLKNRVVVIFVMDNKNEKHWVNRLNEHHWVSEWERSFSYFFCFSFPFHHNCFIFVSK